MESLTFQVHVDGPVTREGLTDLGGYRCSMWTSSERFIFTGKACLKMKTQFKHAVEIGSKNKPYL